MRARFSEKDDAMVELLTGDGRVMAEVDMEAVQLLCADLREIIKEEMMDRADEIAMKTGKHPYPFGIW